MKTAVCLYGQPRNLNNKISSILTNVIEPNNADVFFHAWFDENDRNIKKMCSGYENKVLEPNTKNLLEALNPVNFKIEKQKHFKNHDIQEVTEYNIKKCYDYGLKYSLKDFSDNTIYRCYSMWYSIFKSINMKYLYELENGFKYDSVILMRYDNTPNNKFLVLNFTINDFYLNYDVGQVDIHVNDWFNLSNSKNINVASQLFFNIENLINQCLKEYGYWCNELLLYSHLKNNNIQSKKIKVECSW